MPVISLHDKNRIRTFLEQNPYTYLYMLGDLDDFFWSYTVWYALTDDAGMIQEMVMLYLPPDFAPILLAKVNQSAENMRELLGKIATWLPRQLGAHISETAVEALMPYYHIETRGIFYRMGLKHPAMARSIDTSATVEITPDDTPALRQFYAEAYPDSAFTPRMLQIGHHYGVKQNGQWMSISGVHVYSEEYDTTMLGNIATHPDARGQGLATCVTARTIQSLLGNVTRIGLNVAVENTAAVRCYEKVGFERLSTYGDYGLSIK
jgi:ribosomal protein S18 acetylase RimI-like enzyme